LEPFFDVGFMSFMGSTRNSFTPRLSAFSGQRLCGKIYVHNLAVTSWDLLSFSNGSLRVKARLRLSSGSNQFTTLFQIPMGEPFITKNFKASDT
jgi:hypothetical protein